MHPMNITEVNVTVIMSDLSLDYTRNNVSFLLHETSESQLPLNKTVHTMNITEVNVTVIILNQPDLFSVPSQRRMLAPSRCFLPTCALGNLASSLQHGNDKAGELTRDPFGIGKK
ncbi:uncharacterized protein zgc:193726 isoform X2 [Conger conger]|uniref:uncharacterized protein zgc:193726 isoform X2 n=1 Tax=Conger conger TaxID=82655 RepID=UPI002A5B0082|nr:uncharacterized protein zgc:193726 isoform X2 [Conger conger]